MEIFTGMLNGPRGPQFYEIYLAWEPVHKLRAHLHTRPLVVRGVSMLFSVLSSAPESSVGSAVQWRISGFEISLQ